MRDRLGQAKTTDRAGRKCRTTHGARRVAWLRAFLLPVTAMAGRADLAPPGVPYATHAPGTLSAEAAGHALGTTLPADTDTTLAGLPLETIPADGPGHRVAVILTGDGGWAAADRALGARLAAQGVAVVGFDSPAYLGHTRTPEESASDIGRVLNYYAARNRKEVILIGYSRGADFLPFIVNRLPDTLRGRIVLVAMIGLGDYMNFTFHLVDLIHDVKRSSDVPTRPEVDRMRGMPMLCVYGRDEKDSLCPALDSAGARVMEHPGSHRMTETDAGPIADAILHALPPALGGAGSRRGEGTEPAG
jgi:type IV secretory pathway VirJ component